MTIGFIGLGNMAKAMISGMLAKGTVEPSRLIGSARTEKTREAVRQAYGIAVYESNQQVAEESEVLVLAVKPQMLEGVIGEIRDSIRPDAVIVSIAAGKTLSWIEEAFGKEIRLIRCMPNTPALVMAGCSGVCRNGKVNDRQMEFCMKIFESFGLAEEVPERLIDAVGAVSGSSPAFVFMFMEALADGAVKAGMPRAQAYRFAAQAVMGSAKLMLETGKHPGELKDMVCSPGGTTIEGVQILEETGLRSSVMGAVEACVEKSKQM